MVYRVVSVLSFLTRQCYLPDAFENLGIMECFILSSIFGAVFHIISYHLVGRIYTSGDVPAFGSLMYLLVYSAISVLFYLWSTVGFSFWAAAPYVAAAAVICSFVELYFDDELPWQNRKAA